MTYPVLFPTDLHVRHLQIFVRTAPLAIPTMHQSTSRIENVSFILTRNTYMSVQKLQLLYFSNQDFLLRIQNDIMRKFQYTVYQFTVIIPTDVNSYRQQIGRVIRSGCRTYATGKHNGKCDCNKRGSFHKRRLFKKLPSYLSKIIFISYDHKSKPDRPPQNNSSNGLSQPNCHY